MLKNMLCAAVLVVSFLTVSDSNTFADEQKYELKSAAATIRDVLTENTGKRVIVRMESGENLEGTVTKVGESLVHIAKLSGKDFYDAVVRIDQISAVLFKVRGN
jgi:hypothetical protein